jgi:hypothetical protein
VLWHGCHVDPIDTDPECAIAFDAMRRAARATPASFARTVAAGKKPPSVRPNAKGAGSW